MKESPFRTLSGFMRTLPESMEVAAVMREANKVGFSPTEQAIRTVQSRLRWARKQKSIRADLGLSAKKPTKALPEPVDGEPIPYVNTEAINDRGTILASTFDPSDPRIMFRQVVVRVGTQRAREIVEAIERELS